MPQVNCQRVKANLESCNCSWRTCEKKGNCCLCLHYHLSSDELPACFFPPEVERTYDRSLQCFLGVCQGGFQPTMPAVSDETVDCPRRKANLRICPCPENDCEFRGICCLCLRSHLSTNSFPVCVRQLVQA